MKTRRPSPCSALFCSALCLLLVVILVGCEKEAPPDKAAGTASGQNTAAAINLRTTRLAVIPYDHDKWSSISFRSDGRQVFYQARKKDRAFMVLSSPDGAAAGPEYESITFLVASPDNSRFAFGGKRAGRSYLVVDNSEVEGLSHEEAAPAAFSPDGRMVACELGSLQKAEWFVAITDGEREIFRSRVSPETFRKPQFSPDGRVLVYELGEKRNRTLYVVDLDVGKIVREIPCEGCDRTGKIFFSADSRRMIYDVQKEDGHFLVLHDIASNRGRREHIPYSWAGEFSLSPDGSTVTYSATREGKQYFVKISWETPARRKERGPYDGVGRAVFLSEPVAGSTIIYRSMKDGGAWVVAGDRQGAGYDRLGEDMVFGPAGGSMAYAAMRGTDGGTQAVKPEKWFMVVSPVDSPDDVKEGPGYDMVVSPVFSPDGRRIAYRARTGTMEKARRFTVIADAGTGKVIKKGPAQDEIWPPVWSPDGAAVAYGARDGRDLWWRVETVE